MNDPKPCPFCGGKLNFYRENYVNLFGKRIIKQYWMHDDTDCVLNDINQPFVLGAEDANPETDYPGEYAEKWNRREEKNMTKRFCDLCGKEIFKIQDTYRVIVDNNTDINYASNPDIVDVREICPACAKRIHQTVQELKQEG